MEWRARDGRRQVGEMGRIEQATTMERESSGWHITRNEERERKLGPVSHTATSKDSAVRVV